MLSMTRAIFLAGGVGARQHPLTNDRARPAVQVGDAAIVNDATVYRSALANLSHETTIA